MNLLEFSPDKYVKMILQGKYAFITETDYGEAITQFINERCSIQFHLSEQKAYLSNTAMPMRKSLSKQIIGQINRM